MPLTPHLMGLEPCDPPVACECGRAEIVAIVAYETELGPLAIGRLSVCLACKRMDTWMPESS
jgi:hypothetical protein